MRQFLLILCLFLSSPLFIKGDEEFVAILYLHNGQYVSSDSVYTFFNLDGTYFDSLKSREGNEPTCSRIAKGRESIPAFTSNLLKSTLIIR